MTSLKIKTRLVKVFPKKSQKMKSNLPSLINKKKTDLLLFQQFWDQNAEKTQLDKTFGKNKRSDKLHEEFIVVMTWTMACKPIFLKTKVLIVLVVDIGNPNKL